MQFLRLGCSLDRFGFEQDESYRSIIESRFDWVTPVWETAWAWESFYRVRMPSFHAAVRAWSIINEIEIRGHALIDGVMIPLWLIASDVDGYVLWQVVRYYLSECFRNNRHVTQWDVANELFAGNGSLRWNFWYQRLGENYPFQLYEAARNIAPSGTRLAYCDFGIKLPEKWQSITRWAIQAHRSGLLDEVAIQLHFNTIPGVPFPTIRDTIQRLQDGGLVVSAPESVIWNRKIMGQPLPGSMQRQADLYMRLTETLIECGVTDIGYWTPFDRYQWVWDTDTSCDPGFFECDYLGQHQPKPIWGQLTETIFASKPKRNCNKERNNPYN